MHIQIRVKPEIMRFESVLLQNNICDLLCNKPIIYSMDELTNEIGYIENII